MRMGIILLRVSHWACSFSRCIRSSGALYTEASAYDRRCRLRGGSLCHFTRVLRVQRSADYQSFDQRDSARLPADSTQPSAGVLARLQVRQPGAVHVHSTRLVGSLQLAAHQRCTEGGTPASDDGEDRQSMHEH